MIKPGTLVRQARRKAGLSQRALARRARVPQPTIAAIETGRQDPRYGTLSRLLRASGYEVDIVPRLGTGVDRTLIRSVLRMPVEERLRSLTQEAKFVRTLQKAARGLR